MVGKGRLAGGETWSGLIDSEKHLELYPWLCTQILWSDNILNKSGLLNFKLINNLSYTRVCIKPVTMILVANIGSAAANWQFVLKRTVEWESFSRTKLVLRIPQLIFCKHPDWLRVSQLIVRKHLDWLQISQLRVRKHVDWLQISQLIVRKHPDWLQISQLIVCKHQDWF